jgi:hypothetical protein
LVLFRPKIICRMLKERKVVLCIRALYVLSLTDAGLSSFNLEGSHLALFISQLALHFVFLLCIAVAASSAVEEARNLRLRHRVIGAGILSIIKFGLLFLYFVPNISFYGNFIYYAYVIELGFACLAS